MTATPFKNGAPIEDVITDSFTWTSSGAGVGLFPVDSQGRTCWAVNLSPETQTINAQTDADNTPDTRMIAGAIVVITLAPLPAEADALDIQAGDELDVAA